MTIGSFKPMVAGVFAFCLIWLGGLWTAFVVQNLWNWFLASAIHASELSYFEALGILLLVYLLKKQSRDRLEDEVRWNKVMAAVDVCVPPHRAEELKLALAKQETPGWLMVLNIASEPLGATIVLGIGWVVHTFLA